jgi:exosortase
METHTTSVLKGTASDNQALWQAALLFALLGFLFYRILESLVSQWIHDPSYSHGFFVLLFCAWVVWRERNRLTGIPNEPSDTGLIIIVGALGELVLGVLGAENFLSRTSLLILLAGLVVYFRGWKYFRSLLFPWAVLFLMVPLPAIIFNQVALPLQFQASRLASGMLGLVGVPVLREGNVIQLPSISLDVVEACSGLRSLVSLFTMAVFYGYLFEPRIFWRVLLILAAIPIAVVANGVRIMGSGILGQYWSADKAEGFFHLFSGWVIFIVSLGLLFSFHKLLSWLKPPSQEKCA